MAKRDRPQFNCDLPAEVSQYIREEAVALGKTNGEIVTQMTDLYRMQSLALMIGRLKKQFSHRLLQEAQVQDLESLSALVAELLAQRDK